MAATVIPISTPEVHDGNFHLVPLAAATLIPAGVLVCVNAAGNAVNGSDTAALRCLGRAEETVDNSAGLANALSVTVKRGVFKYANSGTSAVTIADIGKAVMVEDNQTVAKTSTNSVKAGVAIRIDGDGGVWVDTRLAPAI